MKMMSVSKTVEVKLLDKPQEHRHLRILFTTSGEQPVALDTHPVLKSVDIK